MKKFTEKVFREYAKALAIYTKIMDKFPYKGNDSFNFKWIKSEYEKISNTEPKNKLDRLIHANMPLINKTLDEIEKIKDYGRLKVIHSDFNRTNVLFSKGKITGVIDFHNIETAPLAKELGIAISRNKFLKRGYTKEKENIFLNEYEKIYPKNKLHFIKLLKFGKEIVALCKKSRINPILYGSFAYFIYTKDENIKIEDIDFYIPEKHFKKIIEILNKNKINYHYSEKWHTLQIKKGKLNIELDSLDFWYKCTKDFKRYNFEGLPINILSSKCLRTVYKRASEASDQPEKNLKKFESLQRIN